MEKLRKSGALKIMCYLLIPILVILLGFSIFHFAFLENYGQNETNYKRNS